MQANGGPNNDTERNTKPENLVSWMRKALSLEELSQVEWNDEQRDSFLRMQFQAQSRHYTSEYPDAEFQVILVDGQPAGRLYVHRRSNEIRVMDIAMLPSFRQRGTGTTLMRKLLAEGDESNRPVTIHVETFNPARHWYERLGFKPVGSNSVYQLMERLPQTGRSLGPRAGPNNPQHP